MFVLVLSVICCIVFAVWSRLRPRHPLPPILPGELPLIGHAHKLFGDRRYLLQFLQNVCKHSLENGGITVFKISLHLLYMLTDPDESVAFSNICLDKPYVYDFTEDFCSNGLVTAKSSKWKPHRKLLNPAFNQQVLNTYMHEMNLQAKNLASQLASEVGKDPFDIRRYFVSFTLTIVSRTSLGLDKQDQTLIDKDFSKAFEDLVHAYIERGQRVWLHLSFIFKWTALKRKQDELTKTLKGILNPVIQKRKLELKTNKNLDYDSRPGKFKPLLDQMLYLAEEQNAFTDDEIREHLDTFAVGAYDTTSTTLKFTMLFVGTYQDVQEKIFKELQEVLEDKDGDITKYDLPKLVYLEAVIKEILRFCPAIPFVGRKLHTDVKLKNYTLQAGSTCIIGLYGINRHPMWGEDADQFRPERWLDPTTLPDNPNAFATFSLGKRNCIGKLYAMMVMKTALAHILRRYHVTSDITNLESEFDIVIQPVMGHLISLKLRK